MTDIVKKDMYKLYMETQSLIMFSYWIEKVLLGDKRSKNIIFMEWISLYAKQFREKMIISLGFDPLIN